MVKGGAHSQVLLSATAKPGAVSIPVASIASTGYPLTSYADVEKVQRMQRKYQEGGRAAMKPVRVEKLTPELRDKYGVTDESKTYYLPNGHHRLAAQMLEGAKSVDAIIINGTKGVCYGD